MLRAVPPLAWACLALAVLLGLQTLRLSDERAAHAQTRAEHQALAAEAERQTRAAVEAARTEEQRRYAALQEIANETESALTQARADADSAAVAARRLQERLAAVARDASRCAGNPDPSGSSAAADSAADLLSDVQRRLDDAAGAIARHADAAGAAGRACERAYDSLR